MCAVDLNMHVSVCVSLSHTHSQRCTPTHSSVAKLGIFVTTRDTFLKPKIVQAEIIQIYLPNLSFDAYYIFYKNRDSKQRIRKIKRVLQWSNNRETKGKPHLLKQILISSEGNSS